MNTPVINLILEPGKPGCRVTVTSHHDQVTQQFGDPQAALEAALLAGAAISLAEEGLARLQEQARQIVAERDHKQRAVKTSPTGSSYLDEARGEGQDGGWAGPVGPPVSIPDLSGGLESLSLPDEKSEGFTTAATPGLSDDGETLPDEDAEDFTTEQGPSPKAPDGSGGEPGPEYRFEAARQAAASALRMWDNAPQGLVERLRSIKTLLQAAVDNARAAAILLPLDREPWRETELSKMRHIGVQLQEKWDGLVAAGDVRHIEPAYLLMRDIQHILWSKVFSLAGQKETTPACAEASPPAGLPA